MGGKPLSGKNDDEILGATILGPGDFPLRSAESRVAARIRLQRIGVAGEGPADRICFPKGEQPFFGFLTEGNIAFAVKCPLHGDRFEWPRFFVYVSKWLRVNIWCHLKSNHGAQYQKAWHASFPPELWPAEETKFDGRLSLRLKDGTILPAS